MTGCKNDRTGFDRILAEVADLVAGVAVALAGSVDETYHGDGAYMVILVD